MSDLVGDLTLSLLGPGYKRLQAPLIESWGQGKDKSGQNKSKKIIREKNLPREKHTPKNKDQKKSHPRKSTTDPRKNILDPMKYS